jgi:large conductance mechanosensitive channel
MLKEFKEFAMRGNVIDMAVGVIIGGAFGKIITSLVNDVLMPPIGLLVSKVNFSDLCFDLQRRCFTTLTEAKTAGTATINIGAFINSVIDFIIIAFVIFMMVQVVHKIRIKTYPPGEVPAAPKTKQCPYCCSVIPLPATRCPQCTSVLHSITG